jgi:hypothetical protein
MELVAVPRAELLEDGSANLLEAELQDHHVDCLANRFIVNVGFGEIKVGGTKRDRAVAQAGFEDGRADVLLGKRAEVIGAELTGEVVVPPDAVCHGMRRLGELEVKGNAQHCRPPNRDQAGVIDGARDTHVADVLLAASVDGAINDRQEEARIAGNCRVANDLSSRIMEGLDGQVSEIVPSLFKQALKIIHGAINDRAAVQLSTNGFENQAHVDRERFERAFDHLVRMGQLVDGHHGLNLGVHAGGHASNLDGHKFLGDERSPMGQSGRSSRGDRGHDCRKGRMMSSW